MAAEYGSMPTPDFETPIGDQPVDVLIESPRGFRSLLSAACHRYLLLITSDMKKFGEAPPLDDDISRLECLVSRYGDPKIGRGAADGTDTRDHRGGGHTSIAAAMGVLTGVPFERIRFLLTSAAVYFATLGFSNTIIAHDVRGDINGTHSIITDLARSNHMFFQMFTLINIFGFATSSGALLIRVRGKLKSEVMFQTCSTIAFLCMALSLSVLVVVCVFVSLGALAATGSNV